MSKIQTFKINPTKTIWVLLMIILVLITSIIVQDSNLKELQKNYAGQSNMCVRNTADIIAQSQIILLRQKDAHQRDIDSANAKIEFLVNEYNKIAKKYNKPTFNMYSYFVYPKVS